MKIEITDTFDSESRSRIIYRALILLSCLVTQVFASETFELTDSYSRSEVAGGDHAGGLVGSVSNGMISGCYSTGRVTGNGGGLVGSVGPGAQVERSYWDVETSGRPDSAAGIASETALMTYPHNASIFLGWDFVNVWAADTPRPRNDGYPYFADIPPTVWVDYIASAGGQILGETSQQINPGGDGTQVEAVADSGYVFVAWSDGAEAPTRLERNVLADKAVTALFEQVATYPGIAVEHPAGTDLVDGSATLGFGNATIGASVAKTVTVRNTGTASLTGLALTRSGTNAAEFALGALGTTTLAPGASTTFTVTFTPAAAGNRSAALQIASNGTVGNPFDINLTGTGLVPVTPSAPEIVVEHPAGTDLVDGSATLGFGNATIGVAVAKTVTIRNAGNANLTGLALTRSGTNAAEFALGALGATTLAPGASTTFTVTFTPAAAGNRSAGLQIASNDADENPFNISLSGTGRSVSLPPNDAFASATVLNSTTTPITATNIGASMQQGEPTSSAQPDSSSSIWFEWTSPVNGPVSISTSGSDFDTVLAVWRGSLVTNLTEIASNDDNLLERAITSALTFTAQAGVKYHIAVYGYKEAQGNVTLRIVTQSTAKPVISIENITGDKRANGYTENFGTVMIGDDVGRMIWIHNNGTAPLTGIVLTLSGTNSSDFEVTEPMDASLPPGDITFFIVAFKPSVSGIRRATVHVKSNDADVTPFKIELSGNGGSSNSPEITVHQGKGSKKNLKHNKSTRDFGEIKLGKFSKAMIFTIKNDGTAPLNNLKVTFKGKQAGDFFLTKRPSKSLSPGKSTKFRVIYMPGKAKPSKATLQIASNDKDENPFRVKLTGKGK